MTHYILTGNPNEGSTILKVKHCIDLLMWVLPAYICSNYLNMYLLTMCILNMSHVKIIKI